MTLTGVLLAFTVPLAIGFLVMAALDRDRRMAWFQKLILGYFPGTGILMTTMFLMGILSLPLSLGSVGSVLGLISAALAGILRRFPPSAPARTLPTSGKGAPDRLLLAGFSLVLVYKVALAVVFTLQSPTYQDDSLQRWNMRAKVFFHRGGLVLDRQDPEFLGQLGWDAREGGDPGTRAYPPHTSLFKAWVALALGRFEDEAVNLVNPVTYAFFCLSTTVLLSMIVGRRKGLVGGYLLLAVPYLWVHASNPYAEIFVVAYATLASLGLFLLIETNGSRTFSWYFALSLAFLPFTKKEGLPLSAAPLAAYAFWVFCRARGWERAGMPARLFSALLPLAPYLALVAVWTAYQYAIGGSFLFQSYGAHGHPGWYLRPEAVDKFKSALFASGNYNLFPFLICAVSLWKAPTIVRTNLKYLFSVFLVMAAAVFLQLTFTPASLEVTKGTGVNRALIEILPIGLLAAYLALTYRPADDG